MIISKRRDEYCVYLKVEHNFLLTLPKITKMICTKTISKHSINYINIVTRCVYLIFRFIYISLYFTSSFSFFCYYSLTTSTVQLLAFNNLSFYINFYNSWFMNNKYISPIFSRDCFQRSNSSLFHSY